MGEYARHTSLYVQRTSDAACKLSVEPRKPRVLSKFGLGIVWSLGWAVFLDLVALAYNGPSKIRVLGYGDVWALG